jgi:ATP-dependent helicase/nuclease subunit A
LRREQPFTARFTSEELRAIGLSNDMFPADEFVVIQGIADIVVFLEKEIWLLDFKTDDVRAATVDEKVKAYSPQLNAYAAALEKTFRRPVTQCWLHFLSAGQTKPVPRTRSLAKT